MENCEEQLQVKLFNTLSRQIEPLVPINPEAITLYCCGPTVYNYQHIGNLRTYIFEDVLVRMLRYSGYKVTHVMNITDVGHLVSDADEGEDKMLVAVKREKKSSAEIADYYTTIFFEHTNWLNIIKPDVVCKATEHIQEMLELVSRLEQNGYAYKAGGNIYFDVSKFEKYGKLAGLDIDKLQAGARIEVDTNKRNPLDFALWFTKSKFENQELQWDSPWGKGYPGWHIECSAMSMKYCGEHFDIHCGGIDHIPVHHTNEIAQSEGATGKSPANMWLHGGFLLTGKAKMSKSTGKFLTLDVLRDEKIDPLAYRLFCLGGNYRNELMFSREALKGAQNNLNKLQSAVHSWKEELLSEHYLLTKENNSAEAQSLKAEFDKAIFNDLGIPKALSVVHQLVNSNSLEAHEKLNLLETFDQVLGLGVKSWEREEIQIPDNVMTLVEQRLEARNNKLWKRADELRAEILKLGYVVEDTAGETKVKPKS